MRSVRLGMTGLLFACLGTSSCGTATTSAADAAADLAVLPDLAAPGPDLRKSGDMAFDGPCDVVAQDCPDPKKKCTEIPNPDGSGGLAPRCVLITGAMKDGDACTRADVDMGTAGYDDCGAGLFCSSNGSQAANLLNRHCRAFCRADADCKDAGQKCLQLTSFDGLCSPACTPFGTDCPMGYDCSSLLGDYDQMTGFAGCRQTGNVALGKACMAITDCVAGATCLDPTDPQQGTNRKCTALCDAKNKCAAGTCNTMLFTGPNGLGFCK